METKFNILRRKFVFYYAFGILVAGSLVAVTAIGYFYIHEKAEISDRLDYSLDIMSMTVDEYFAKIVDVAVQITSRSRVRQLIETHNRGESSLQESRRLIRAKLSDAMLYSKIVDGINLFDAGNEPLLSIGLALPPQYHQFSNTPAIHGPVVLDGDPRLLVSAPILDKAQRKVGTEIIVFRLNKLQTVLADRGTFKGEQLSVVANNDHNLKYLLPLPSYLRSSDVKPLITSALRGKTGRGVIHRGQDILYSYKPLANARWASIISIQKSVILKPLHQQIGIFIGLTFCVVVLGGLMAGTSLRPLSLKILMHADELESEVEKYNTQLLESKQLNNTIIANATDGIILINAEGHITLFNQAAQSIFGYRHDEIIGKPLSLLMQAEHADRHNDYINHYLISGEAKLIGLGPRELIGKRKNGDMAHVEVAVSEVRAEETIEFAAIVRDITNRKHAEKQLREDKEELDRLLKQLKEAQNQLLQSEKLASIGQLAAGVAHEINNPVGYISSNINNLERYIHDIFTLLDSYQSFAIDLSDQDRKAIDDLKRQLDFDFLRTDIQDSLAETMEGVWRVKQIVQDLKDFSHVDEGEWHWSDIHKGLDSTLNIVHNDLKYKAEVIKEYGDLPEVECLPSQLNQVFMNMLVNAAHAIEDNGYIRIRTFVTGQETACIQIQDTGKGIEPEQVKKIFDPFFTTKPVGQGTGLGLSLSYGIIEKHGGRIQVQSRVGEGTTFSIEIPITQSENQEQSHAMVSI